jgi:hypothetical protein
MLTRLCQHTTDCAACTHGLAPSHAQLGAYWGAGGAAALSVPTRKYFQSPGWTVPPTPARGSSSTSSSSISASTNATHPVRPTPRAHGLRRRRGGERAHQEQPSGSGTRQQSREQRVLRLVGLTAGRRLGWHFDRGRLEQRRVEGAPSGAQRRLRRGSGRSSSSSRSSVGGVRTTQELMVRRGDDLLAKSPATSRRVVYARSSECGGGAASRGRAVEA